MVESYSFCKVQKNIAVISLLFGTSRKPFSIIVPSSSFFFVVFATKQSSTICSPDASYAVAVGSIVGRRGRGHSGAAPGDLRDRAGCQAALSTPIAGGLSRRRRHGEPSGVGHWRLVSA